MSGGSKPADTSWMIPVAGLSANMLNGTFSSFGVFMTLILEEFGWSRATISLAFSLYTISHSISALTFGRVADRYGPRVSVALGGLLTCIGFLSTSFTSEVWQLYVGTGVIMGLGIGAFWPSTMLAVARIFTGSRRLNLAVAVNASGTAAGSITLPPLAAMLVIPFGWRGTLISMAALAAILVTPATTLMRRIPQTSVSSSLVWRGVSAREAARTRDFRRVYAAACLGCFTMTLLLVHLAPYAVENGMPLTSAGFMMGLVGLSCLAGRLSSGSLARLDSEKMLMLANILMSSVAILIILLRNPQSLYAISIIFGFSWGLWAPQFVMILNRRYGEKALGSILGLFDTAYGVGGISGPSLGGYIRDSSGTYSPAFLLSAGATALAAILLRVKGGRKEVAKDSLTSASR